MSNILQKIVNNKRIEVKKRKQALPLSDFIGSLKPSSRSFEKALSNDKSDFILECKKASPSKGLIRQDFDLDVILDIYQDFASAISVLTDKKYFQGDFKYLKQASEKVDLPILCKDFFIDSYQVYEARLHGADAILLMLSVLDNENYNKLAELAELLRLDILTEVHDEQELERAIQLKAKIIGINNRNLKNLSIDLATTEKLVKLAPKNTIIISESGIESRRDIKRLSPLVNGFLIGSSIMSKENIREHCKALIYGKVKICGLTRKEDIEQIEKSGSTYAGFIFYPKSKRYIKPQDAKIIAKNHQLKYVGVFVNEEPNKIIQTAKELNLYAIQLHGNESDNDIEVIKDALPKTQLWKAIHISEELKMAHHPIIHHPMIDRYLLDTHSDKEFGGTGKSFNWEKIENLSKEGFSKDSLILAGGINSNNIQEAESQQCYALDISSGVEIESGIKSKEKINQVFAQLRA